MFFTLVTAVGPGTYKRSPSAAICCAPQPPLLIQAVDLDHHAVDLVSRASRRWFHSWQ
jgi:hypothetical protein